MKPELIELQTQIVTLFNLEELRGLCFEMGIQHENIAGMTRNEKARELVEYCVRHARLDELLEQCKSQRPATNWSLAPSISILSTSENNEDHGLQDQYNTHSKSSSIDVKTDRILLACRSALTELFALQYPWGEWSDRRTRLESIIAERESHRGPQGPKPNVARTLFALDVLGQLNQDAARDRRVTALSWMNTDVLGGWYLEWTSAQSLDSESSLPHLMKRKDIRHTAQIVSAFCRWKKSREPLASLLKNVVESRIQTSGFWPEGPDQTAPRLLASVYAVEALGHVLNGEFRLPLDDLLDERWYCPDKVDTQLRYW